MGENLTIEEASKPVSFYDDLVTTDNVVESLTVENLKINFNVYGSVDLNVNSVVYNSVSKEV